jgi:hypothetical protein
LFRYEKAKKDIFAEYKPVAESSVVKDLNDRKRFKKKKKIAKDFAVSRMNRETPL